MTAFRPAGVMTALVTPFHPDGSLNWQALAALIEYQLAAGVTGLAVTAGSGEYVSLTPAERAEVVRRAADCVRGRVPVIAGILAPDTASATTAARAAQSAGAQALLLLTPYYIAPSLSGLVTHFRTVAEAVDLPLILYNNPSRTGLNLDLPALELLADIPAVVAIKECDRDLGRVAVKIMRFSTRLDFLSGDDDLCLPIWAIGASGGIMSSTNVTAPWAVRCFEAVKSGDWTTARLLFYTRLLPFLTLYRGPDHPGPLKQVMSLVGLEAGRSRPPLAPLEPARLAEIAERLHDLGLRDDVQALIAGG